MDHAARGPRLLLESAFRSALSAASPDRLLRPHLDPANRPDLIVAVGKASVAMAQAALDVYRETPTLIIAPHGSGASSGSWPASVRVMEAGHPVPDDASVRAGQAALASVAALRADQQALVLISGGGSALMSAPLGVTLPQKRQLTDDLLRSGAGIAEINTVRKHLSAVKGGRLAQATRATVCTFLLSDVVGDIPGLIASGPTVPEITVARDALTVLNRYRIDAPEARAYLSATPDESPRTLPHASAQVIGGNRTLLDAARQYLQERGVHSVILGDTFTGEARALAAFHAQIIRSIQQHGTPVAAPVALLSGGEATVQLGHATGRGGRNLEFALALMTELGEAGIYGLSAGSDGRDGTSPGAGAFMTPDSLTRARHLGLDPHDMLDRHDSHTLFEALGDILYTGLTGHNLNDIRLLLVR
ncbi:glycerate kinase type-2 family protein [Deinococcus sedimenti]|uniref:Glycerate dehydrogenase n=1 Tax=Deinococcus sedimenti TaxID=1867090 RepID=A0ABQ2SCI6_9DEIO|nr:glycerate kinase [Deinococcus sedimenti]GGS11790.1 glycerate dehydrogenase [Deinococcus sedimenti]